MFVRAFDRTGAPDARGRPVRRPARVASPSGALQRAAPQWAKVRLGIRVRLVALISGGPDTTYQAILIPHTNHRGQLGQSQDADRSRSEKERGCDETTVVLRRQPRRGWRGVSPTRSVRKHLSRPWVDHPLQRPARADDRRAGRRVRKGHPGSRSRSATTTRTPSTPRSSPKGRARPPTSSTPRTPRRSSTSSNRVCSRRSTPRRSRTPRASTTRPKADWVGVSARVSVLIYNPRLIKQERAADTVLQLADPRYKGSSPSPPVRPTSSRSSPRCCAPTGRRGRSSGWTGIKANAGSHIYPDNETIAERGEPRSRRLRGHQPVLLVPACARRSARRACTPRSPTSRRTTPAMSSTSRARRS